MICNYLVIVVHNLSSIHSGYIINSGGQVSSVIIVSGYGLGDREIEVRPPAEANLCVQTSSGAHSACCPMGTGGPFPGVKRVRDVTLTTHHHLVPRSRISRSYTSSSPSAFTACSGTPLIKLVAIPTILFCSKRTCLRVTVHELSPLSKILIPKWNRPPLSYFWFLIKISFSYVVQPLKIYEYTRFEVPW